MKPQSATNPSSGTAERGMIRMLPGPELRQGGGGGRRPAGTLRRSRHSPPTRRQALPAQPGRTGLPA